MKNSMIVFATLVLLSLPTFAERPYNGGKMHTMANIALIDPFPANPSPDPCTCSCGKNCDGSCTFHVSGCGLGDGFICMLDCCSAAPDPIAIECSGGLQ
jgi:hypothetical protein